MDTNKMRQAVSRHLCGSKMNAVWAGMVIACFVCFSLLVRDGKSPSTYTDVISLVNPKKLYNRELIQEVKIAWFMTYPESGTAEVLNMIQQASRTSPGTNYGQVRMDVSGHFYKVTNSIPAFGGGSIGPALLSDSFPKPSKYLLTRTHSAGTCYDCHPYNYMSNLVNHLHMNYYATLVSNGQTRVVRYHDWDVEKMIILFRDPMDNVAARFYHKFDKARLEGDLSFQQQYPLTVDGFRKYCANMDNNSPFRNDEKDWFRKSGILGWTMPIPCGVEFVKIFEYLNCVIRVGEMKHLDVIHVTVKDIAMNPEAEVNKMLQFLELPRVGLLPPQSFGFGELQFRAFFTKEERESIALLGQKMLSPSAWGTMSIYLEKYIE